MESYIERFARSERIADRLAGHIEERLEAWCESPTPPPVSVLDQLLRRCRQTYGEGRVESLDEAAAVVLLQVAEALDAHADDLLNPPHEYAHAPSTRYRMHVLTLGIPLHDVAVGVFAQDMLLGLSDAEDRIALGEDSEFVSHICRRVIEVFDSGQPPRSADARLLIASVLTTAFSLLGLDESASEQARQFVDNVRPDSFRNLNHVDKVAAIEQVAIHGRASFARLDQVEEGVALMERLESIAKQHLDDVPAPVHEALLELMLAADPVRALVTSRDLLRGLSGRRHESDSEVLVVARALVLASLLTSADHADELVEYWYGVAASSPVSYGSSLFLETIQIDGPMPSPYDRIIPDDPRGLET